MHYIPCRIVLSDMWLVSAVILMLNTGAKRKCPSMREVVLICFLHMYTVSTLFEGYIIFFPVFRVCITAPVRFRSYIKIYENHYIWKRPLNCLLYLITQWSFIMILVLISILHVINPIWKILRFLISLCT
jgi:hypothetical protein